MFPGDFLNNPKIDIIDMPNLKWDINVLWHALSERCSRHWRLCGESSFHLEDTVSQSTALFNTKSTSDEFCKKNVSLDQWDQLEKKTARWNSKNRLQS